VSELLERLDKLIASTTAPSTTDVDLRAFVDLALEAQAGRAQAARKTNADRAEDSDIIRGQIRAVVGVLPLASPLRELVDVVRKRLEAKGQSAGAWQIEDELRQLRREAREASDTVLRPRYFARTLVASEAIGGANGQGQREGGAAGAQAGEPAQAAAAGVGARGTRKQQVRGVGRRHR
jgi:hypothetical protein